MPYPKDKERFWQLVQLGSELRQIHLLESPVVEKFITQYPVDGDNVVDKPRFVSTWFDSLTNRRSTSEVCITRKLLWHSQKLIGLWG